MDTTTKESAPHPGDYIREEIKERGWNQRDLAFVLGCPEQSINLILAEKRGISADMSKALGEAFDVSPELFVNLQRAYDLARASVPRAGIAERAHIRSNYPVREMINRGWLKVKTAADLEKELAKFFEVDTLDQIPYLAHSAKKTGYEARNEPPAQLAWLFRVRQIAMSVSVPAYSADALNKTLERLSVLRAVPEEARHVPRILFECGVRFIMVEALPKSKIDGVTFWLNGGTSPVIALSSRLDRIDNFWFVLRHEIEHVLRGHGKGLAMMDAEMEKQANTSENIPEEEVIANTAAAEFCVPKEKIESFIRRKNPFFYEKDVVAFSRINGVHPGLVVGQIQHWTKRYDYLRNYQVKVRHYVAPGSIADGWGQTVPIT